MIIQQIISGILGSGIYALFAVGFTLIFGIMNILNMTHADLAVVTAFTVIGLVAAGFGLPIALLAGVFVTVGFALIIERVAMRPGRRFEGDARVEMPLIATIGASMVIQNTAALLLGNRAQIFPLQMREFIWINGYFFSKGLVVSMGVAVALLIALELLINRTSFGRQMRAVAMNPRAAEIMGINPNAIITITVMITALLASAAGILVGVTYGLVGPFTGIPYAIKGLVAMIIGGVGSVRGAVLGALLIGVCEAVATTYFGSQARDVSVFIVLVAVLALRPAGLLPVTQGR